MADENNTGTEGQEQDAGAAENAQAPAIDYDKIQGMIDKGTQQKESAILKSYFEQQGMAEADVKAAITEYKNNKAAQANQQTETLKQLQESNKTLSEALKAETLNANAYKVALDMGIDRKSIPYALKMADFSGAFTDKGELNGEEIQKALDKVKADVPALFSAENENKGFKIGADGNQQGAEDEQMKTLRNIMGLKTN